jgi:hypothetical protein
MAIVKVTDTHLQACLERNLAEVGAGDGLCRARALMRAKPNHPVSRALNTNISMRPAFRKI